MVESILDSLRRGQRQLARNPRAAIDLAVTQLLALGRQPHHAAPGRVGDAAGDTEYRIDDLARSSGVTVRNIRAYQERGLLHPPRRVGRTALFDESHLSRLRIITSMLERGYTSAHILEMLQSWEGGLDLADVLGLERALVPPRVDDMPQEMSRDDAIALCGGADDLARFTAAGLLEAGAVGDDPGVVRVLRPRLLAAFAEMRGHGMSVAALLGLHEQVTGHTDRIGRTLAKAGAALLAEQYDLSSSPTSAEVGELVAALDRFRALAFATVTATLTGSIERAVEEVLADYLSAMVAAETDAAG